MTSIIMTAVYKIFSTGTIEKKNNLFLNLCIMLFVILCSRFYASILHVSGSFGDLGEGFSNAKVDLESICFGFYSALWAMWGL